MADGYTLSDQEMRDWVVAVDAIGGHGGVSVRRYERWLAAHDEKVRAEQREADAVIAETRYFGGGTAAAIRAVPANTNTEEPS